MKTEILDIKKDIIKLDKQKSFYCNLTSQLRMSKMNIGYIAKLTTLTETIEYYACKELFDVTRSWQYHIFGLDIVNKKTKEDKFKIKTFKSLNEAFKYLSI